MHRFGIARLSLQKCAVVGGFFKRRYKSILYYAAMAAVLALIASAAESYRSDREGGQALILPENMAQETLSDAGGSAIYPQNMGLLRPFCAQPVWNEALSLWETHAANDYGFADDQVICLEDGIIIDAGESSARGGYLEIEAENGTLYRYCCVLPTEHATVGQSVRAGEIIAEAGEGMPSEAEWGKHLHLEVYRDGVLADFEQIYEKRGVGQIDG